MEVQRIQPHQWRSWKQLRLRALQDAPEAFARTFADENREPDQSWIDMAQCNSVSGVSATFIAWDDDGGPAGGIGAYLAKGDVNEAHICAMWVPPELRESGIGRALVESAAQWLRGAGAGEMKAWVSEVNTGAQRFYAGVGFRPTQQRQPLASATHINERLFIRATGNRSSRSMSRLSPLTEADLDAEQRKVLDAIQGGPRGKRGLMGPFGVYVRAPGVGNAAQALGAAVRFNTELGENVKEVAICTVGAFFHSRFEFAAHAALASKAGVAQAIIDALQKGETPEFDDEREHIAHRIASQLLASHRIDDATYAQGQARLGETQLVELVATVGYYCLVSFTLNAFQVPLGEGMTDPFPDVTG